jgi:hypothetical protein
MISDEGITQKISGERSEKRGGEKELRERI